MSTALHSINEYEGLPGVTTYLVGGKLNRLEVRRYLKREHHKYFGAFATDDGIVAYTERGQDAAFKIKGSRL